MSEQQPPDADLPDDDQALPEDASGESPVPASPAQPEPLDASQPQDTPDDVVTEPADARDAAVSADAVDTVDGAGAADMSSADADTADGSTSVIDETLTSDHDIEPGAEPLADGDAPQDAGEERVSDASPQWGDGDDLDTVPDDADTGLNMDQASIDELLKGASFDDPSAIAQEDKSIAAAPLNLQNFSQIIHDAQISSIDLLRDVELNVKIVLGRSRMLVEDVLKLTEGVVVELDKLAGDPVDVFVNDRLVARGEVLVLNDNFCVRINEIAADAREEET